ncbi:MAG: hypothetical protein ACFCU9_10505 [Cyanophyceae cyanobacterium]
MKYPFFLYSAHNISPENLKEFFSRNGFLEISNNHWGYKEGGIWVWNTDDIDDSFYYLAKGINLKRDYSHNDDIDIAVESMNETKKYCDEAMEIITRLGSIPKSTLLIEIKPEKLMLTLEIIKKFQKSWSPTILDNKLDELSEECEIDVNEFKYPKKKA